MHGVLIALPGEMPADSSVSIQFSPYRVHQPHHGTITPAESKPDNAKA